MNLLEMQKLADARGDNVASMIIQNFLEAEGFFGLMEFNEFGGSMSYGWNEEKELPLAQTRSINDDYTENNGETKQLQEALKVYGGLIGVDRMAAQQLGNEIVASKQASQIKAIRLRIMNDFFNGSSTSDVEQMDGLKTILGTGTAGRVDRGFVVDNGGGALSRKKLDDLIGNTDVEGAVIFADKMVPSYINQYGETLVTFDKNEFGAPVARYGDIPIVTIDRNNLNAKILGFSEAGSTSSMFLANIGVDAVSMLSGAGGLTSSAPEQSGSSNKHQIDWLLAAAVKGDYNLARLHNFTANTMVA